MKRILCIALVLLASTLQAQETIENPSVEKSTFNVQTGFLGLYVNNEYRLAKQWALRTEAGLDAAFAINSSDAEWGLAPMVNLEPRYYYNLPKRAGKGRNVTGNAASFFTVSARFNPGELLFSTDDKMEMASMLCFIPKWGIRRNIGQSKFNYEAGLGIGYYTLLGDDKKYYAEKEGVAVDLHLRIGYRF